ncbi:hypothetical protein M427DRAFT_56811 [Gonapodya prolifera JEL478]|uniref:Zn(2)-C6 fungal-type domain-containing protein n=1 Tax=Gonapodya prolifera (strain JEL478) TaxID=1344416 RepID=A0A139AFD2_GONPJ|nr:hypothetical protein M427DRAFT_56811 [Gonapodya prolifera JEL478]|eukprot:KXS15468.1 hypothetical protein M427DRAFT_56811 [Gonapodya prolifera JEL478]
MAFLPFTPLPLRLENVGVGAGDVFPLNRGRKSASSPIDEGPKACDRCASRKKRCDGGLQSCPRCKLFGVACTYNRDYGHRRLRRSSSALLNATPTSPFSFEKQAPRRMSEVIQWNRLPSTAQNVRGVWRTPTLASRLSESSFILEQLSRTPAMFPIGHQMLSPTRLPANTIPTSAMGTLGPNLAEHSLPILKHDMYGVSRHHPTATFASQEPGIRYIDVQSDELRLSDSVLPGMFGVGQPAPSVDFQTSNHWEFSQFPFYHSVSSGHLAMTPSRAPLVLDSSVDWQEASGTVPPHSFPEHSHALSLAEIPLPQSLPLGTSASQAEQVDCTVSPSSLQHPYQQRGGLQSPANMEALSMSSQFHGTQSQISITQSLFWTQHKPFLSRPSG